MTTGDIDDKLGPEGELAHLRDLFPNLDAYLSTCDDLPIILVTGLPYGAGISTDGQRRYVDSRLDTMFQDADIKPAIARHESVEWALRKFYEIGEVYASDPRGHRLANRAELEKVTEIFYGSVDNVTQVDEEDLWSAYDDFLDPQLAALEHMEIVGTPADLALYPYAEDEDLLREIKEAQREAK